MMKTQAEKLNRKSVIIIVILTVTNVFLLMTFFRTPSVKSLTIVKVNTFSEKDGPKNNVSNSTQSEAQSSLLDSEIIEHDPVPKPPSQGWIKSQMDKMLAMVGYNDTLIEYPWTCNETIIRHTYFFQNIKTIFTGIPKSGCTNWIEFLLRAEGALNKTLKNENQIHKHISNPYRLLDPGAYQALQDALNTSKSELFSFMVVRNPWTRIVSGYRDKLSEEIRTETPPFRGAARTIAGVFNKVDNITNPSEVRQMHPTFNQYLRWLLEYENLGMKIKPNDHFQPQWQTMCLPSGSYDFIIPLEYSDHFAVEIEQRIKTAQRVPGSYDKSSDPRNSSSTLLAKEWLSKQDPQLIERLYSMFEADFTLMNYSNFSHPDFPLPLYYDE